MTNFKKSKKSNGASLRLAPFGHVRSKLFIVMLCVVALAFSYSCKCRNESTNPPISDGSVIQNTISFTNMMIVKSDGSDTAQPITVTIENAQVESWDITDSETDNTKKLTKDDFADSANLFANNQNTLKIKDSTSAGKLEASGAEKTVTISFKFKKLDDASGDATLKQPTYSTEIKIKKAVEVTDDKISEVITSKSSSFGLNNYKFLFTTSSKASNSKLTVQNESATTTADDKLNPEDFKTEIQNNVLSKDKISPYYTGISDITYTTAAPADGGSRTFTIKFNVNPEYEITDTYTMDITAKSSKQNCGSWSDYTAP